MTKLADLIWKNAELLRGAYKENEYRKVILPFTILRRLDCVLEPTREAVIKKHQSVREMGFDMDKMLTPVSGYPFFNTSHFSLPRIAETPDDVRDNLEAMINGFSQNVRDIFEKFGFSATLDKLEEKNRLYLVLQRFAETDLAPGVVDNHDMGQAFEELLRKFNDVSPEVTDEDSKVLKANEGDLNDLKEHDDGIKQAFNTGAYQVLIVASKFQTGFDQPKLCAMYVDKRLDGVLAVQTLSRLNRMYPGKKTTFVLDFRNDAAGILKAFLPYYRSAKMSGVTDPNLVHTLRQKLDDAGVYLWAEVLDFSKGFFDPKGKQASIQSPLKKAHDRFKAQSKEVQDLFRGDVQSFIHAYDFLSQLRSYDDADLERLHAFCRMLLPRLLGQAPGEEALDKSVRLAAYKLVNKQVHALSLAAGKADPLKPMGPGGGQAWDDPETRLSEIIKKMNAVFAGNLSEADLRGYATTLIGKLVADETLHEQANANDTVEAFGNGAYETKLNNVVVNALENHSEMAGQALRHESVFKGLAQLLVEEVYLQLRQKAPAQALGLMQ